MLGSGRSTRRLRLLIGGLLVLGALLLAVPTVIGRLQLQLWAPLTLLLAVVPLIWPELRSLLNQAEARLDRRDQEEEARVRQLADGSRRDLLEEVRQYWVQTELKGSYKHARIALGMAEHPAAVEHPLRAQLRRPPEPDHLLEPGTPIGEIYRELSKQLLILGGPGAGKTTLLLELTQELLEQAASTAGPVPVVFHLSSWAAHRRSLATWIVDELYKGYGVPLRLGQLWVDTEQLIPLLDGLDEVEAEHRNSCLAAINAFHDDHGQLPMVVCSRVAEYEELRAKLRLRGAIVVQPLTPAEVERYLQAAGRRFHGVRIALRDDEQLSELLTTPLFLSIVALAYMDKSPAEVRASGSLEERRQHVLADYVAAMLARPERVAQPLYSTWQAVTWLAWLARAMRTHSQSLFYLDWMQPNWAPTRAGRRLVTVGPAAIIGMVIALVWLILYIPAGVAVELVFGLTPGLIVGAVSAVAVLATYAPTITPTERLRWSRTAARRQFRRWLIRGSIGCGLTAGAMAVTIVPVLLVVARAARSSIAEAPIALLIVSALCAAVVVGLICGLALGLLFGLIGGLESQNFLSPPAPGRAIRTSMRNGLRAGLLVSLVLAIGSAVLTALLLVLSRDSSDLISSLVVGGGTGLLVFGLPIGLIVGVRRGGGAYLRHYLLRWVLAREGCAPRAYPTFLEFASRVNLLQRRGGGYEFIHHLLLEYFARLEPSSETALGRHLAGQG